MAEKAKYFPEMIHVRCPSALPNLIEGAAQRQCMTPSEYIRLSLVERLKGDGVDVAKLMTATAA